MRSAVIDDGIVKNVIAGAVSGSVECGPDVAKGWSYDGSRFIPPPAPPKPTKAEILAEMRNSASMTRAEFAIRAAALGYVTSAEAKDWAAQKAIPATLQAAFNQMNVAGQITAMRKLEYEIAALTTHDIPRNSELMPVVLSAFGVDDAGADALFGIT